MKDYVKLIGREYFIHFANCDWVQMTAEQHESYMRQYVKRLSEVFEVPAPELVFTDAKYGMNASYCDEKEVNGKKYSHVIFASNDLIDDGLDTLSFFRSGFPGVKANMTLTHETVHARDGIKMEEAERTGHEFHVLDICGTPYSLSEMQGALNRKSIRTSLDYLKTDYPVYPDMNRAVVENAGVLSNMYMFTPPERSAMSSTSFLLREFQDEWNEYDKSMHFSDSDRIAMDPGCLDRLVSAAKFQLEFLDYPDSEYRIAVLNRNPEKAINEICHEQAKVYADEPDKDPKLAAMMRMGWASQYSQTFRKIAVSKHQIKREERLVRKEEGIQKGHEHYTLDKEAAWEKVRQKYVAKHPESEQHTTPVQENKRDLDILMKLNGHDKKPSVHLHDLPEEFEELLKKDQHSPAGYHKNDGPSGPGGD